MILSLLLKSLGSLTGWEHQGLHIHQRQTDRGLGIFGPVQLGQNMATLGIAFYAAT